MSAHTNLSSACCARPSDAHDLPLASERIRFFNVPLGCEAARGLGCGVKAKPVLDALAGQGGASQAWLNRKGTIVALLWQDATDPLARSERIRSILAKYGLAAHELTGAAREAAIREFFAAQGWYRGNAVDRLSEEEAAIIAIRVVRRVTARVRLSDEKAERLSAALTEACRRELVERPLTSARVRRRRIANEIVKAGRTLLEGAAIKALQEAAALGHRPVSGEE